MDKHYKQILNLYTEIPTIFYDHFCSQICCLLRSNEIKIYIIYKLYCHFIFKHKKCNIIHNNKIEQNAKLYVAIAEKETNAQNIQK